jgi:hypothetical protein
MTTSSRYSDPFHGTLVSGTHCKSVGQEATPNEFERLSTRHQRRTSEAQRRLAQAMLEGFLIFAHRSSEFPAVDGRSRAVFGFLAVARFGRRAFLRFCGLYGGPGSLFWIFSPYTDRLSLHFECFARIPHD